MKLGSIILNKKLLEESGRLPKKEWDDVGGMKQQQSSHEINHSFCARIFNNSRIKTARLLWKTE